MSVPFVDLGAIHRPIRERILSAIAEVVDSERYILGEGVRAFEEEIAAFLTVPHAVGVSSGTDALLTALMALGVGRGDEVITTPFTFIATASVIARLGARPVFADIEADGFNLDPAAVERAITPTTRAIIVVHLFGRPADMSALGALGARHGVPLIEDCAQAIGAEWQGRRVGGLGRVGCFSFFPAKNLGCLGDGGLVTTDDATLAARIRRIRVHGAARRYVHDELGGNFRLDAIQAAVLRVKLAEVEGWNAARQDNAFTYQQLFGAAGLIDEITLPETGPGRHVWNQYVVRVPKAAREHLFTALGEASVGCAVYYPIPLHLQPVFKELGYHAGDMPEAERAADEVLALPIAPGLTREHQDEVVRVIGDALRPS